MLSAECIIALYGLPYNCGVHNLRKIATSAELLKGLGQHCSLELTLVRARLHDLRVVLLGIFVVTTFGTFVEESYPRFV